MGKRRSIVRQVLDRFDGLMATGEGRHAAKLAARAAGEQAWSVSDGRLHAFRTRKGYQAIVLRLVNWCAASQGLRLCALDALDAQAEELVARYLAAGLAAGKSAWTLKTSAPPSGSSSAGATSPRASHCLHAGAQTSRARAYQRRGMRRSTRRAGAICCCSSMRQASVTRRWHVSTCGMSTTMRGDAYTWR